MFSAYAVLKPWRSLNSFSPVYANCAQPPSVITPDMSNATLVDRILSAAQAGSAEQASADARARWTSRLEISATPHLKADFEAQTARAFAKPVSVSLSKRTYYPPEAERTPYKSYDSEHSQNG